MPSTQIDGATHRGVLTMPGCVAPSIWEVTLLLLSLQISLLALFALVFEVIPVALFLDGLHGFI